MQWRGGHKRGAGEHRAEVGEELQNSWTIVLVYELVFELILVIVELSCFS